MFSKMLNETQEVLNFIDALFNKYRHSYDTSVVLVMKSYGLGTVEVFLEASESNIRYYLFNLMGSGGKWVSALDGLIKRGVNKNTSLETAFVYLFIKSVYYISSGESGKTPRELILEDYNKYYKK